MLKPCWKGSVVCVSGGGGRAGEASNEFQLPSTIVKLFHFLDRKRTWKCFIKKTWELGTITLGKICIFLLQFFLNVPRVTSLSVYDCRV